MTIRRPIFFLLLFLLAALPFLLSRLIWLAGTKKTVGEMRYIGKNLTGQIEHKYSVIRYGIGKDSFWLQSGDDIFYVRGEKIPVRYRTDDPQDAKIDRFSGIWLGTVVYAGIPFLLLLVFFLHPHIIPYQSQILVNKRKPFIHLVTA